MEKGYSGLRRTRKRAHSTKCPCCYSSEDEPENHASTKKEKSKECNQDNGKRTSTRKKVKIVDVKDADEETLSLDESVSKAQKGNKNRKPKKGKIATMKTSTEDAENDQDPGPKKKQKQNGKVVKFAEKKTSKVGPSFSKNKDASTEQAGSHKSTNSLQETTSDQTKSRTKRVRKKISKDEGQNNPRHTDKINSDLKAKTSNNEQNNAKAKTVLVDEETLSSDLMRSNSRTSETEHEKLTKTRFRSKSIKSVSVSNGEPTKEKEVIPLASRKRSISGGSLSERKIDVFDHLFSELKKCPGLSKVTVSSAAEMLLKLTAEKLKTLVEGLSSKKAKISVDSNKKTGNNVMSSPVKSKSSCSVSEPKRKHKNSEKSLLQSPLTPDKPAKGKSEQVKLSQAAEALVSFRANPTILRQENKEADILSARSPDKDITSINVDVEKNSASKESSVVSNVVTAPVQTVTSSKEQGVSQAESNTPSHGCATSQVQSSLVLQGPFHQPVRFPTSIEASLQQVAQVQQNLLNLSQVTSQLSSAPVIPPQLNPRLTAPCSVNPSVSTVMDPRMLNPAGVQNIQGLFCRPVQPSNIQTSMTVPKPVPSLSLSGNNQQALPQQPLKGMENVVSCVGSRSTANLLWNIKPATPVVYLTSPQTLSGVRARNFIPQSEGQMRLPFTSGVANVSSVGAPKASQNSTSTSVFTLGKVTWVSQATPPSVSQAVSTSGQRPILPREQRAAAVFPSGLQSAPQLPPTTVVGPIPRNIPPVVLPSSVPIQLSSTGAATPLNTRQTVAAVVTQAPCITTIQTTATSISTTTAVTPVSAKQAVKKFVHERTKSAELKRTGSLNNLLLNEPIAGTTPASVDKSESATPNPLLQSHGGQSTDQAEKQSATKQSEFNLHQAVSALLSISSQDGLDAADSLPPGGEGDDSLDEHEDEVVFTTKGVFRVGDVDVDPKYNRIGREGYTCGKCGKIFTSLSYLARHIKRVCPDMSCRKWKCTMCDKAFRHPFGLQQHIYTHTGERPHKCSQCPKAFYSSNDLRRHSRIHSGERPYHCKHCDKSFATTISLKTHTYIHTGEKPHKCPHCPKTFATSSKLGRHIVTHSEQRPFACDHCPKSFNRSGDLRRHNMHVHELRDRPLDFGEGAITQINTNNNTNTVRNVHKDQDGVSGQLHSECGEIKDPLAGLDNGTESIHGESVLNKSTHEAENLDESTESGSGDST